MVADGVPPHFGSWSLVTHTSSTAVDLKIWYDLHLSFYRRIMHTKKRDMAILVYLLQAISILNCILVLENLPF